MKITRGIFNKQACNPLLVVPPNAIIDPKKARHGIFEAWCPFPGPGTRLRGGVMAAHVDVRVAEELQGDVGAVVGLGGGGQVGVAVPLPAGAVGVAGGWGGVLHPGGGDDAHRLALVGRQSGGRGIRLEAGVVPSTQC